MSKLPISMIGTFFRSVFDAKLIELFGTSILSNIFNQYSEDELDKIITNYILGLYEEK